MSDIQKGGRRRGSSLKEQPSKLIPVGLVHRNLEPEQWVMRVRNLPSPNSTDPASAPLQARKYLLTWKPRTTAWVLGDLTEEEGDAYRASTMARGPAVPDMSALAQDHELEHLSVSPERYADVRMARAKTQFPLEDPCQPRGGRKAELSQIASGEIPAMPPPPDRIYYAPAASQVPASSHMPTVLQDSQGGHQGNTHPGGAADTPQPQPQHNNEHEQQQHAPEGDEEVPQPHNNPAAAGAATMSFYSPQARSAFVATSGRNRPRQEGEQGGRAQTQAKAPPPKPPSSSEDEWPSEGEAPPEEEESAMVQLGTSTCRGSPTTTSTTTPSSDSSRGSRSRSPDRGAGPSGGHTSQASSSSMGRTSHTYPPPRRPQRLPEEQQFARGVLPRWRTGAETSPRAAITAGRGELRRINPAQMAATLVEVVRHILRDTLHATSVRTELSEVGELLEDVVADFGASIRLRDSEGIAEGRDALMEAVDILDQIVMNYDTEHDEFTMNPATLQDDLLRLAQQLQIVVPAHNNLMGDIRGELPSQRPPSCNSQELFEGYGDEMGLMQQLVGERGEHHIQRPQTWTDLLRQIRGELNNMPLQCRHACVHQLLCRLHRPGPDPAGDTEEGHRCALQLLFEHEFPESYRTNGQCEADAIWLLLRGERLGEYIDGMNLPAEERVRGGRR